MIFHRYQSYTDGSFNKFLLDYMNCDPIHDCTWASGDFGKPNLAIGKPILGQWDVSLEAMYKKVDATGLHILLKQQAPAFARSDRIAC
jgi:hypothetical protein